MEDKAMLVKSGNLFPSFPSLIDRFLEGDLMDWTNSNFAGSSSTLPAVNVRETVDDYEIEVAAPGMKKEDFKINYDNGRLVISSERSEEKKEGDDKKYSRREFSYQSFQRTFAIPENVVNGEKISAKYQNGILSISLPKHEELKPKPAKEIKIS